MSVSRQLLGEFIGKVAVRVAGWLSHPVAR
jgi:hypothetical protein